MERNIARDFVSSRTSFDALDDYSSGSSFFYLVMLAGSWLDISKSFGRKKGSRPKPPKEVDDGRYSSSVSTEARSLNSRITPKMNVESRNGGHISPTKRFYSEDRSLNAEQAPRIPSYESLIMVLF